MYNQEIVPFGKYKGQPIDVLFNDKDYLKWLLSNTNFITEYPALIVSIINHFLNQTDFHNLQQEVNMMQVDFLEKPFCVKFLKSVLGEDESEINSLSEISNLQFQVDNISVTFDYKELQDKKNNLLREYKVNVWIFGAIDENYNQIITELNKIVQKDDKTLNILYAKSFLIESISKKQISDILKNQNIYLKFKYEFQKPFTSYLISSRNKIGETISNNLDKNAPFYLDEDAPF